MEERRTRSINWPEGGGQKERKGGFGPGLILSAARCVQIFSTGNLKTFKYFYCHPGLDLWQTLGSHDNQIKGDIQRVSFPVHTTCILSGFAERR